MDFFSDLLVLYFAPTIVAFWRRHRSAGAIALLNIFFGWTIIGWIVTLFWSQTAVDEYDG